MRVHRQLWLVWWVLAPCALCCGRGFWPFPVGCRYELGEMEVDVFSSCMVGGCWRCVPSLRGCRLVVRELCGWACCPLRMSSALSRCIRGAPSLSRCCILFLLSHRSADWLQRLHHG
ncbi:hypothetical protein Tc00.1047053504081.70 [Trypanosoma cruzi]|uniref:Secreted protein n=1 Tax=Trypanosoma cruzi (strain CL Brener) TaxID=353153 RepID=Q4E470_TRYCC|nr:hypothetical protein Tc00.1047053504081.70 [Trypanosoma cruzi]EAN99553.1 hypothetical protein Tc00.1047053504081.70 [Trypanosoma cruzi]|eukprot:XP_821404.1 hypothetical protein [Trypanosoma cruzi strain CL Brener]